MLLISCRHAKPHNFLFSPLVISQPRPSLPLFPSSFLSARFLSLSSQLAAFPVFCGRTNAPIQSSCLTGRVLGRCNERSGVAAPRSINWCFRVKNETFFLFILWKHASWLNASSL